jgi:hypothetical protein
MKGVVILAFHHKDDKLLSIYRNIKSHGYFGKLRLNMPYHRHFSPDLVGRIGRILVGTGQYVLWLSLDKICISSIF